MAIKLLNGRWVATEKLARERDFLRMLLQDHFSLLTEGFECDVLEEGIWYHKGTDTLIELTFKPRITDEY